MGWLGRFRPGVSRLSRRATTGLLAGVSILASRPAVDLLTTASDLAELVLTGVIVYQLSVDGPIVGHHLSWVFIGYIVYAYTPELYLGQFGTVVEARGFRVIAALETVYFGVLFGRGLEAVPAAGAFTLVPSGGGDRLAALIVGIVASILLFSSYILLGRGERLLDEDGNHFEVADWFSPEPASRLDISRQLDALPRWARALTISVNELAVGVFYVIPCFLLGPALASLNLFYPIPEGAVFVGFVASYVPGTGRFRAFLPTQSGADIELRIADEATDAVQNMKGVVLSVLSLLGIFFSGAVFLIGLVLSGTTGTELLDIMATLRQAGFDDLASLPLLDLARLFALLWGLVSLLVVPFVYALFGLVYWFQQLRRIPLYAAFWEQYWHGRAWIPPEGAVRRPVGLFLPGAALWVVLVGGALLWTDGEPPLAAVVGIDLLWTIGVAIVGWSVYDAVRGEPQSLAHEGRDVIVALLLQTGTIALFVPVVGSVSLSGFIVAAVLGAVVVGMAYWPDASVSADQQGGAAVFVPVLYLGVVCASGLALFESSGAVPPVVYLVVGGLLGVLLLLTYASYRTTIPDE